ncbi:hypothetical protein, partial [Salinispora arenicola]|uniref:hypothetical protein n=1 Tax=Salinispora arenicola TaxID=168697 RepID=UPI0027DD1A23
MARGSTPGCRCRRSAACADAPLSTELFETIVSFENVPIPEISFAEENMAYLSHDVDGRPQYPMSLVVLPGDDMPLRLVYDRQRFGEAAAHRMLERLHRTLTALVDSVDGRVRRPSSSYPTRSGRRSCGCPAVPDGIPWTQPWP